jgi:hypothetical protein
VFSGLKDGPLVNVDPKQAVFENMLGVFWAIAAEGFLPAIGEHLISLQ